MSVSVHNVQGYDKRLILAGFVAQGTSLRAWCLTNGVKPQNAHLALTKRWTGPKATALVEQIVQASKVDDLC